MAGLFSPANTPEQDDAVAIAIAGPVRLTFERLTPEQVVQVLHWMGYCWHCGEDLRTAQGEIRICCCTRDD